MDQARLVPVKVALLSFPVFFLGGLAFTLHGGPCVGDCHTALFWRAALGGPLAVGVLAAALPMATSFLVYGPEHDGHPLQDTHGRRPARRLLSRSHLGAGRPR
jgi:hypothetical protein